MMKQLVLADLVRELDGTRRVLERAPEEHFGWRPHEKSMTLGGLATHVVNLLGWQSSICSEAGFDLASVPSRRDAAETREALLTEFEERRAQLEQALDRLDDEALLEDWTLRRGEEVVVRMPRAVALRSFGVNHMVHHRAQLTVYLRLLDVPVPGLYGPSADEAGG